MMRMIAGRLGQLEMDESDSLNRSTLDPLGERQLDPLTWLRQMAKLPD